MNLTATSLLDSIDLHLPAPKNMDIRAKFSITLLIAFLVGCAAPPYNGDQQNVDHAILAADQAAQIKLAEAASSVSTSLQTLAEIEKANHPKVKIPPPPNPASLGMARLASVDWDGPVEPLIRKIAGVSFYQVRVLGKPPAIPALVSITAQNIPLADILRDATFQAQKKADIVVYPRRRIIEIRYLNG